jgi:N-acyl homoserine lactone hydrolase
MSRLYLFECGTLKSEKHLFTLNKDIGKPFEVPVPFFLIQHKGKNILFDSGNGLETAIDAQEHWKDIVKVYEPVMSEQQFVTNQLKNILGITPEAIDFLVLSHLHLDHAGGVGIFPNATYITHKKEYEWAFSSDCTQKSAYIMKDITKKANWLKIDNDFSEPYDLFNDDVIKMYLTPGHTPGHLSLFIRLQDKSFLLTADSCYTEENLNDNVPPGLVWNEEASLKTLGLIKEFQSKNTEIIVGHDPEAWKKFKKAPEFYS